jgi:hypothetical protein
MSKIIVKSGALECGGNNKLKTHTPFMQRLSFEYFPIASNNPNISVERESHNRLPGKTK